MNSRSSRILLALALLAAAGLSGCYVRERRVYTEATPYYGNEEVVTVTEAPVPPPLVTETVTVSPGPAYVWIGGYHEWRHGHWEWVPGHWDRPIHPHAVWAPAHWEHYHNGWVWRRGYWR